MFDTEPSKVSLLLFFESDEIRAVVEQSAELLKKQEPLVGTHASLDFAVEFHPIHELDQRLDEMLRHPRQTSVVLVSDCFTSSSRDGGYSASDSAQRVRQSFVASKHVCGLIGLVRGPEHRTQDLDQVVDISQLNVRRIKEAISKTANGLCLKLPPSVAVQFDDDDAIVVHAVRSEAQMRECLALRFQVYELLAYLEEPISASSAAIEMDSFDLNSIHFVAIDRRLGDVIGSARLVIPQVSSFIRESIIGVPAETWAAHARWCVQIAYSLDDPIYRSKLDHPYFVSLPILQSTDFKERWPQILQQARDGSELSRVVVSPGYRGLGISRLLIRTAVATAVDLQKKFLMLECIPTHAEMYAKYGFVSLEGHHCRTQELDQIAVGMRLGLEDSPFNRAVSLARRDIAMIKLGRPDHKALFGSKCLCLCNNSRCWREGEYGNRGRHNCPLRELHCVPVPINT